MKTFSKSSGRYSVTTAHLLIRLGEKFSMLLHSNITFTQDGIFRNSIPVNSSYRESSNAGFNRSADYESIGPSNTRKRRPDVVAFYFLLVKSSFIMSGLSISSSVMRWPAGPWEIACRIIYPMAPSLKYPFFSKPNRACSVIYPGLIT